MAKRHKHRAPRPQRSTKHKLRDDPSVSNDLQKGYSLHQAGRLAEAQQVYAAILSKQPKNPDALHLLGAIAVRVGKHKLAANLIGKAISVRPNAADYHSNFGLALHKLGKLEEAATAHRRAIKLKSDFAEAHNNLGLVLQEQGELQEAIAAYRRALDVRRNYPYAYNNLGNALKEEGKLEEAVLAYRTALELKPTYAEALYNLGGVLIDQAKIEEAAAAIRKSLRLKPNYVAAHSNLLFCINYQTNQDRGEIFAEHLRWSERHAQRFTARLAACRNQPDPDRRLRVGYVSPDFRTHSVAYFFEALLAAQDTSQIESICYAHVRRPDDTTTRLRNQAGEWRDISRMSDDQAAEQIRRDGTDILVDLAGHTGENRLLLFARRCAPVQVTYIGYCNTTGLPTIDFRLTDDLVDPEGEEDFYSEALFRLPRCFLCYTPPTDATAVSALPSSKSGLVTFGSFNNLAKVTRDVVALWSEILRAVPSSRLVLKSRSLDDPATVERYAEIFAVNDVARDRIDLHGHLPSRADHLALYGSVDIGLDPFPYNGTTTTCEALWMGVPVITLMGSAHAGRVGASLLAACNLGDLIAESPSQYVAVAKQLADDRDRLSALRSGLRSRMAASSVCDQTGLARAVESAYRTMWRRWCASVSSTVR